MSDIVSELRRLSGGYAGTYKDAADEIERLKNGAIFKEQAAELTRLRAEVAMLRDGYSKEVAGRCKDAAETARLGYGRTAPMQRVKRLENDLMESLNALGKIVTMADRAIGCGPSEQDDYLADISDTARKVAMRAHAPPVGEITNRPCTCHPDDNPPVPCPKKYSLGECRIAALGGDKKDEA